MLVPPSADGDHGRFWNHQRTIVADAILPVFGFDDRDLARGDFAQRRHHFLVFRLDQRTGAFEQLFGAASRS